MTAGRASIEANCPSTRASERALRSASEKSRFTMSSPKPSPASAVEPMSTSLTLENKTTESSHSKLTRSDTAKLLFSIGDQFKNDSENMVTEAFQIDDDLEELSPSAPGNNAQEVFGTGVEGVWPTQTFVTQWLDELHDPPGGWKNA